MFLNKYDLLEQKLQNGVKVNRYLPSFGDRENSGPVLARCAYLPIPRRCPHLTVNWHGYAACRSAPEVPRPAARVLTSAWAAVLWLCYDGDRECLSLFFLRTVTLHTWTLMFIRTRKRPHRRWLPVRPLSSLFPNDAAHATRSSSAVRDGVLRHNLQRADFV